MLDDEVETALHEAFDMAEIGMRALERSQTRSYDDPPEAQRAENRWDEVWPRHQELQNLIKNLFAHDDIINERQTFPDRPNQQEERYKQTLKNLKLRRVYRR